MPDPRPRPGPPLRLRLRLPRRTARLRLTVLYGAAFLTCGAAVLAVVAYLLYGPTATRPPSSPPKSSAAAVFHARVPSADVRPSGGDDVVTVPVRVPAADVQQSGGYDIVNTAMSVATAQQLRGQPVLTPAEQAKLLADAQFHVNYDKREILILCAIALAAIAVAAASIGWLIAGRVLRPVSTITATARRIAASSLHERLGLHGPDDELKELGDTLDDLFARLEASFDVQRRFAANASHELRTPLTRERALLQVTLADPASTTATWQAVSRELLASNAEQERLIEALLTLAGSEAGPGERELLDLTAIAGEALAAARPAIGRLGLHVQAGLEPAILDGDPLLVQQLVTNLIDNAVRHNGPGGTIQVTTKTSAASAVLSVTNSGPVIPPAEVDRLFQPFQRFGPRPARHGHGLGLSIVRTIATAHGATIRARARPSGGLTVDVTFLPLPPVLRGALAGISRGGPGCRTGRSQGSYGCAGPRSREGPAVRRRQPPTRRGWICKARPRRKAPGRPVIDREGNTAMSVLTAPPVTPASPPGPPKLTAAELRRAQAETLRTPRFRYSAPARLLFWIVDVIYGRQRTLRKFIVLEIVARVPYQAWERAAYGALTRVHPRLRLAGRIFERVVETRAQQDNEQYHLLILEELAQRQGSARPFLRFRLLPWLMAVGYYQLSWLLYVCWPAASYRLNAAFEDHAEHDYMLFVTEHPEWEAQRYDGSFQAGYGHRGSLADLFRQIGHDERVHKLESLAALDEPRLRDDLSAALEVRGQRLSAGSRSR